MTEQEQSDAPRRMTPTSDALADALTPDEERALAACEAVVEEHIGTWVNVTNALAEIAARKLYRQTHTTFEAYCRERWGLSRSHGYRLVLLARVGRSSVGDRIRNERQAREIASLLDDPDLLERVVDRAVEIRDGKPLTGPALRQARAELTLPPEQRKAARAVYEATEWTEAVAAKWAEEAAAAARRYVEHLPPRLWGWGQIELRGERHSSDADTAALAGIRALLAFDAPLTDEVVGFLRAAPAETPLVEVFTDAMGRFGAMAERLPRRQHSEHPALDAINGVFAAIGQGSLAIMRSVADRMAEVLVAVAETPALPPRTWTPEQIAEARAAWSERVALARSRGEVEPWEPGPLRDAMSRFCVEAMAVAGEIAVAIGSRPSPAGDDSGADGP